MADCEKINILTYTFTYYRPTTIQLIWTYTNYTLRLIKRAKLGALQLRATQIIYHAKHLQGGPKSKPLSMIIIKLYKKPPRCYIPPSLLRTTWAQ